MNFITKLFSSDGFMPHGHCYFWNPSLVWLHVISDSLIALAYLTISMTLIYIARKRRDLPFDWMFACFGIFILACGAVHALEVWTLWIPTYWLSGTMKAITAAASVATAILLLRLIPRLLAIPSPGILRQANSALVREVAERLRAEDELRVLFDLVPAMICFKDTENRFLRVNKRLAQATGKSVEEIEGKLALEIYPKDAARYYADDMEVIHSGAPKLGIVETLQGLGCQESWVQTDKVPYCDKDGKVVGIVVMVQDITERKRVGEALRESEERFSDAFQHAPIGMALVSFDGRWLKVNRALCDLVGYSEAELLTRTFQDITHSEDLETNLEYFRRALSGEIRSYQMEKRYVHARGHLVTVLLNISLVRDGQGLPRYFVAHIQDITERRQAEEALRESEERFRGTFEQAAVGIAHVSAEGRFLRVNEKLCEIVGFERQELLGMPFSEITVPEDRARSEEARRAMLAGDQSSYTKEKRYRRKNGEIVWINLVTAPERSATGHLEYFISVFQDITLRKQTEHALRESEEKFRQMADNVADVFWVTSPDLGAIHYVSAGYELIWGRSADSLYAHPHQRVEAILPEERQRVVALFTGLMGNEPKVSVEYRIARPDGAIRWIHDRGFQVRDAAGNLIRLTGIASDITARKRAEEELFRSRETLRGILDHIPQRVFWKDRDLVYQGCNHACALAMGYNDPSEVIGKTDFEASWNNMAERYRADDRSVMDLDVGKFGFEEPGFTPNGHPAWLRTSKIPLHDLEGRVTGVLGTYEDITEHKLAKLEIERLNADLEQRVAQRTLDLLAATKEAERANRAKSQFLSRTSHELRTPMNAILGFGQLLEMEEDLGPEPRDNIEQLLNAGRRLMILIDEVLDISDAESGGMALLLERVAVDQLVEETLGLARPLGATFRVELEMASPLDRDWSVLADPHRLNKVLFHLLSNAIKYNRPGGKVILECAPVEAANPPAFRFCVKDTGSGISAENLTRLFTPFDRLDAERTRKHVGGAGLGLALSKRLVELMGGRIGVESVVGEGSTFWIEVLLAKSIFAKLDQSAPASIHNPQSEIRDLKTVLYIEENLSNLRLTTRILARRPAIQLLSAEPGAHGLELAREHLPDLILLDLHLPDGHGQQMLAGLRADPRTADIPVVILSADGLPGKREQMLSAGARAFLAKPVQVRALLGVLDRFIEFQPEEAG
jgi:PAS domain S-box-containing protein